MLVLSLSVPFFALAEPTETESASDFAPSTMQEAVDYLLRDYAGVSVSALGQHPRDWNLLAGSVGLLEGVDFQPAAACSPADFATMLLNAEPLYEAMRKVPMEPFFVNGLAQPIFPRGNSSYYDTSGEGIARFIVWVETDYDTDYDGKLDLIKVVVQLPRAAVDQGMKVGTVYHAQPYNEGTNDGVSYPATVRGPGQAWLDANGPYPHAMLHKAAEPRVPTGELTTAQMVQRADWTRWRYSYSYAGKPAFTASVAWGVTNGNQVGSLNTHDYYTVRGFAAVSTAGIGTLEGEGLSTYGADIEIAAYVKVIDWLNGRAKAYVDKDSTFEVKADWSNGLVAMTGTSYGGTTPLGVASSGVEGLEAIVPVCGIISYYEYQNQQGAANWDPQYTPGMVWYIISSLGRPSWFSGTTDQTFHRQMGYMQQMYHEAYALNAQYGEHWALRDYTKEGWYKDWGPSKIKANMLIVAGGNDNNVRPKQCVMMHEAAQKAGVESRLLWMQGHHMTPNNHMIGEYVYQEWLNLWFSHHLYGVDNGVLEKFPTVYAQSNQTGNYDAYDFWETNNYLVLDNNDRVRASSFVALSPAWYEVPVESTTDFYLLGGDNGEDYENLPTLPGSEPGPVFPVIVPADVPIAPAAEDDPSRFTLINSANGGLAWQNMLNAPTAGSTLWSTELTEDVTVKGIVWVNFRAAIQSMGSTIRTGDLGQIRVHARLVEVAAPGRTVNCFGTNTVGATIATTTVASGGVFQGGGLSNGNLVRFTQTTNLTYREIARGWMSLAHPDAGWEGNTATPESRLPLNDNSILGVFHDYSLHLQPAVHTAKAGNRLVLILSTGNNSNVAYTGNNAFTFTVDNEFSNVQIPMPAIVHTVTFVDWDGAVLAKQKVMNGEAAGFPYDDPTRDDWVFIGWDEDFSEVVADLVVTAQYDPTITSLKPSAFVTKYTGNKNGLTITVTEVWSDGALKPVTVTLMIDNNAAGTYSVGPYRVYVDTKGNTQIREIRVVG